MKRTGITLFFLFISALFAVILPVYIEDDASILTAARKTSPGLYFNSKYGLSRYRVFGKRGNPTVVLVHSFNGFIESWNPNIQPLVQAGYRVVAYDLFGRGLSDRPNVDMDLSVFRSQLKALIEKTEGGRVHLIGASFGSVIASDYALHFPARVNRLILVGPAGWPKKGGDSLKTFLNLPLLADVMFHYSGNAILKPKVEAYFFKNDVNHWALKAWIKNAAYPGFNRSSLSILRHAPVRDFTEGWRRLGGLSVPVLMLWGKQDVSFPFSNTGQAAVLMPRAEIIGFDNAAHWVNIEQAEPVNKAIVSFLGR